MKACVHSKKKKLHYVAMLLNWSNPYKRVTARSEMHLTLCVLVNLPAEQLNGMYDVVTCKTGCVQHTQD